MSIAPAAVTDGGPCPSPANRGEASAKTGRLYILDLLRFVAAMSVFTYHFGNAYPWGFDYHELFRFPAIWYGWIGVPIFFVISGFVICMSSWGRSLSAFFSSRIIRLIPAYVAGVLITATVTAIWTPAKAPELLHVLVNLTMLQSFVGVPHVDPVYWTLVVELKFYLLISLVVAFGLTYRRVILFCATWTVGSLFAIASGDSLLTAILEPSQSCFFIAGIALYLIYRFGSNLVAWGVLATSWILCAHQLQLRVAELSKTEPATFDITFLIFSGFLLLMIGVALRRFDWVRWRFLVTLGALTYPVYLLHLGLGKVAVYRLRDSVDHTLLVVGLVSAVLLLAYLIHRLVERPASQILKTRLHKSFHLMRKPDWNRPGGQDAGQH